MRSGKVFSVLACACLVLGLVVPSSATSIVITGNSGHGQGGVGNWNISSQLGSTVNLAYNSNFSGQGTVVSLGNGMLEQLACVSNSFCSLGDGTGLEVLFLIPTSQITSNTITFSNVNFSLLTGLESLSCSGAGAFNFQGPGFLCSNYNSSLNLSSFTFTSSCTPGSTCGSGTGQLILTFNGSLTSLCAGAPTSCSVTLGLFYNNNSSNFNGPTVSGQMPAPTPEPTSMLLFGTGMVAGAFRLFRRKA